MMRVWIALAALSFAWAASADNVLMKSNGLGAAAAGMVGIAAGTAALAPPPVWQGFPKGGSGPQFQDDPSARPQGDCAASDGATIAKALKGEEPQADARQAQDGQIRLTDPSRTSGGSPVFDSKAIYGSGQPVSCTSR